MANNFQCSLVKPVLERSLFYKWETKAACFMALGKESAEILIKKHSDIDESELIEVQAEAFKCFCTGKQALCKGQKRKCGKLGIEIEHEHYAAIIAKHSDFIEDEVFYTFLFAIGFQRSLNATKKNEEAYHDLSGNIDEEKMRSVTNVISDEAFKQMRNCFEKTEENN